MESIFHEQQEGSLCAQHCLNALLQGNYFTAVDLAELAQQLDETERQTMAEAGMQSAEYQRFMQQPSGNYDDSGFFSIQVLQNALQVWNLELIPFTSTHTVAEAARNHPTRQIAYICNFKEHWFTIRRLGNQWFNLNSLLTGPELVSDTYLALLLKQLQNEGYSIFVVLGSLPDCESDQVLRLMPAIQPNKPSLITDTESKKKGQSSGSSGVMDEDMFHKALEDSRRLQEQSEDADLEAALALSMQGAGGSSTIQHPSNTSSTSQKEQLSAAELRQKRLAFLEKTDSDSETTQDSIVSRPHVPTDSLTEEEQLERAIRLSMGKS